MKQKRPPVKGGAVPKLPGDRVQPFYQSPFGDAIAPLTIIIAAELDRRLLSAARAAKAVRQ
jgi:hypothetical protein